MATTTEAPRRKSLRELRQSDATLFCKNNTGNKITCNDHDLKFELDPFEIAIMPKECLNKSGMQRLWMRKAITISDDEDMENEIILHLGGIVELTGPRPIQVLKDDGTWVEETPKLVETSGSNDIVMKVNDQGVPESLKCVIGGEPVYLTKQQLDEGTPPLCGIHAPEGHKLVSMQNQDGSWTHKLPTIER